MPILRVYNLPAGICVPAGNLGQPPRWNIPNNHSDKDETIMSEKQVAKLEKDGFEILSHSTSHSVLTEINDNRLQTELEQSKHTLGEIIGREVVGISYPHGAYDKRVYEAAKKAGLENLTLLEEPQAAFYCWLATHSQGEAAQLRPGDHCLVIDVGGGTTDFSLIQAVVFILLSMVYFSIAMAEAH